MTLTAAIISIFGITGSVWFMNRFLKMKICPICVGVSGTWLWLIAAKFLGYEIDIIVPAILMGGSVVGIAYQVEKRLIFAGVSASKLFLWKIGFIPTGFVAVYGFISAFIPTQIGTLANRPLWWTVFGIAIAVLVVWALRFIKESRLPAINSPETKNNKMVGELEKKMKDCC